MRTPQREHSGAFFANLVRPHIRHRYNLVLPGFLFPGSRSSNTNLIVVRNGMSVKITPQRAGCPKCSASNLVGAHLSICDQS